MPRRLLPRALTVLVVLALLLLHPLPEPTAEAAGRTPKVPSGMPTGIEALAGYVPNNSCTPGTRPGTDKLAALLRATYPSTSTGTSRACNGSVTEHSDGRAVDLMLSTRSTTQRSDAQALLSWLLATDSRGNRFANARRLGVMYLIWDGKIWSSYRTGDGWREYNGCSKLTSTGYDTTCHRDHVHVSLSWEGAMGSTSFWSGKVAGPRYGACVSTGYRWAPNDATPRSTPCPRHTPLSAPTGSSAVYKALARWAGMYMKSGGATGTPVRAWQQALGVKTTGSWDTATKEATKAFQRQQGLSDSGTANTATWKALLARHAPR